MIYFILLIIFSSDFWEEARLAFSQKMPLLSVAFHPWHLSLSLSLCLKMKLFEFLSDVRNLWDVDGLSMRGSIWCNEFAFKMSLHPSFLLPFFLFLPSHKISPTCSPLSHSVMYAQSLLCHMRKHSSDIIFAQLWHRALQGPLTLHWNYQQNSPSDETLSVCIQAKGDVCCYFLLFQFKTELCIFLLYIHYIYTPFSWVTDEPWWILTSDWGKKIIWIKRKS